MEDIFRSPEEKGSREWKLARGYRDHWGHEEDSELVKVPRKKPREQQPGYIEVEPERRIRQMPSPGLQ